MNHSRVSLALVATALIVSAASTIFWCASMSGMEMSMPGGWSMSTMWMRMPDQSWSGIVWSFARTWTVMMIAMMLPANLPMLLRITGPGRLVLTAAGYFTVWSLVGLAMLPAGLALTGVAMQDEGIARAAPLALAAVVLAAGAFQFSGWKMRQLACCRNAAATLARAPSVARAWQDGVRLGARCVACNAGWTLVLVGAGAMDLRVMVLMTIVMTVERLAMNAQTVVRWTGGCAVAAGLVLAVRYATS